MDNQHQWLAHSVSPGQHSELQGTATESETGSDLVTILEINLQSQSEIHKVRLYRGHPGVLHQDTSRELRETLQQEQKVPGR